MTTGAYQLPLGPELRLNEAAEVALEDYAREMTGSETAEAVRGDGPDAPIVAIRLTGLAGPPEARSVDDIAAFARELSLAREGGGLGWS